MRTLHVVGALAALLTALPVAADVDLPTKFTNQGSIANTRHNMTQRPPAGGIAGAIMDPFRNNYEEVCVYCHTPHGANGNVAIPLWNRTIRATTYATYDTLGTSTLTQPVTQPGPNSLACLSCHDGQTAVDSVINMPNNPNQPAALYATYPGGYLASQTTTQNITFLNAWNNQGGPDATVHVGLNPIENQGCLACHSSAAGIVGAGATDFRAFVIGTDLTNDHPVGVRYPTVFGANVDFNVPAATRPGMRWFDGNGNSRPDAKEIRLYDSGDGYEVECASCHDPHGVPSGAPGSVFNPTFLRIPNTGSAVCLTCHIK